MIRRMILLLMPVLAVLAGPAPAHAQVKKYALLVGINEYKSGELTSLEFAENDASEMASELRKSGYEVKVLVGRKATRAAIMKELQAFKGMGNKNSIAVVGLAGHGIQPDGSSDSFYCPYDSSQKTITEKSDTKRVWDTESMVRISDVINHLGTSNGAKVLFVDACRNAPALGARGIDTSYDTSKLPNNCAVLLSCSAKQKSFELAKYKHGAFFYHVLQGMRKEAIRDGKVTAQEIGTYIASKVKTDVKVVHEATQEPHLALNAGTIDLKLILGPDRAFQRGLDKQLGRNQKIDLPGSIQDFEDAAKQEHTIATAALAMCYIDGKGVPRNETRAKELVDRTLVAKLEFRADDGDPAAQSHLGGLYFHGLGVEKNQRTAFSWFKKAAEQDDVDGQVGLAWCFCEGWGTSANKTRAVEWAKKAAEQDHPEAMTLLGRLYNAGAGVDRDDEQAFRWLKKAADRNESGAQIKLGWMYYKGDGVEQNAGKAVYWVRKAAEQGFAHAQFVLGVFYLRDEGVKKDEKEAVRWLTLSARQGHKDALEHMEKAAKAKIPEALYELGQMYLTGTGVEKNAARGISLVREAARNGHSKAQRQMGESSLSGLPGIVKKDKVEAIRWYAMAARQGEKESLRYIEKTAEGGQSDAQAALGEMYITGTIGGAPDLVEGEKWMRKAADQGHPMGQFAMGVFYLRNDVVTKDDLEAIRWFTRAAKQGHKEARAYLEKGAKAGYKPAQDALAQLSQNESD